MDKSNSKWFITAFGDLYPLLYPHRDDTTADTEIEQLIGVLNLTGDELVLDVCCGAGRHLKALRARGYDAWGIDLSESLLVQASSHRYLACRVIRGDIRCLPFSRTFDAVLNLFTSFGYFLDDEQNVSALHEMISVLDPQGVLVIDHINRSRLECTLIKENTDTRGEISVLERRKIEGNRVIKEITVHSPTIPEVHITENVRLYYPNELKNLLVSSGLTNVRLFGSFDGEPLYEDSERMIAVGYNSGSR